jgi:type IV pilus assembly protein PilX
MTLRQSARPSAPVGRQRGAILVTSLLLLVTLTIIGISVVQITRMQERMAGNQRDLNLAFQGAEAALRDGETQVAALTALVTCTAAPCPVYERNTLPVLAASTSAWWTTNGQEYGVDGTKELTDLADDPQLVVEHVRNVPFTLNVDDTGGKDFFQITARSTGASGLTNTLAQTTFAQVVD